MMPGSHRAIRKLRLVEALKRKNLIKDVSKKACLLSQCKQILEANFGKTGNIRKNRQVRIIMAVIDNNKNKLSFQVKYCGLQVYHLHLNTTHRQANIPSPTGANLLQRTVKEQ